MKDMKAIRIVWANRI